MSNWEASDPGATPATVWEDNVGSLDWSLGGGGAAPTLDNAINSSKTSITSAYVFDGNDTATIAASWPSTTSNATIEMWLRPRDLSGNEALFEVGGNTDGSSFRLEDSTLLFRVKDGGQQAEASADLSGVFSGDFVQVVGEIDLANDLINLYVDGMLVQTANASGTPFNDYAGTDNNGLGSIAGQFGGNIGGGFSGFDGDIAIVRFSDSLLGPQAILDNFNALQVPEPTSFAVWSVLGMLGVGIAWRCSRHKRKIPR